MVPRRRLELPRALSPPAPEAGASTNFAIWATPYVKVNAVSASCQLEMDDRESRVTKEVALVVTQ